MIGADIIMQLDDVVPSTTQSAERFEVKFTNKSPCCALFHSSTNQAASAPTVIHMRTKQGALQQEQRASIAAHTQPVFED